MLHDEVINNENKPNEPIKDKDFYSDTYPSRQNNNNNITKEFLKCLQ